MTEPRVLQFGTGVFLRGHFDWMLQRTKEAGLWDGSVIGVKLTPRGRLALAERPSYPYTSRGIVAGIPVEEHSKVSVVESWLHPYESWPVVLGTARLRTLDVVVSNSTEAGLAYAPSPPPGTCPDPFPAKLLAWLHMRFEAHPNRDVTVLPLELVDDNGARLREAVEAYVDDWCLGVAFGVWLRDRVTFRSTLVDRIVTKPGDGDDPLLVISEPYHLLAIEGDDSLEEQLPFREAGLNVVYTDDLASFATRKVRVLNGAHHTMLFLGLMCSKGNVKECMDDPVLSAFVERVIVDEVLPTIDGDRDALGDYVATTLDRFRNPWLDHRLSAIALNSCAKVGVRLLPTIADAVAAGRPVPEGLALAVAAYCAYDHDADGCEIEPVRAACAKIPGLPEAVDAAMTRLDSLGPLDAMRKVIDP